MESAEDCDIIRYLLRNGNHFPDYMVSYPGRLDSKKVGTIKLKLQVLMNSAFYVIQFQYRYLTLNIELQ